MDLPENVPDPKHLTILWALGVRVGVSPRLDTVNGLDPLLMDYVERIVLWHTGLTRLDILGQRLKLIPVDTVDRGSERSSHVPSDLIECGLGTEVIEPPEGQREYDTKDQAESNDQFPAQAQFDVPVMRGTVLCH